jgi:plastocyanin
MKRRDFLRTASGVAGATAAAAPAVAQEETTEGEDGGGDGGDGTTTSGDGGGGGGGTETVAVGPDGNFVFRPGTDQPLYITPGTTVQWVWESDTHNIVVDSQPDDAEWEGHETIEDTGFEYEHTFEVPGEYHYYCEPHRSTGMVADLVVNESGQPPGGGGGGGGEVDPEHMGVPFQAHFVGLATILTMIVSIVFTFFFLKYGESANTKGGNN